MERSRKIRLFIIGSLVMMLMNLMSIIIIQNAWKAAFGDSWYSMSCSILVTILINHGLFRVCIKAHNALMARFAARMVTAHLVAFVEYHGLFLQSIDSFMQATDKDDRIVRRILEKMEGKR